MSHEEMTKQLDARETPKEYFEYLATLPITATLTLAKQGDDIHVISCLEHADIEMMFAALAMSPEYQPYIMVMAEIIAENATTHPEMNRRDRRRLRSRQ